MKKLATLIEVGDCIQREAGVKTFEIVTRIEFDGKFVKLFYQHPQLGELFTKKRSITQVTILPQTPC